MPLRVTLAFLLSDGTFSVKNSLVNVLYTKQKRGLLEYHYQKLTTLNFHSLFLRIIKKVSITETIPKRKHILLNP